MTTYRDRDGDLWATDQDDTVTLLMLADDLSGRRAANPYANVPFDEACRRFGLEPVDGAR